MVFPSRRLRTCPHVSTLAHESHTLLAHVMGLAGTWQGRVGAQAVFRSSCCANLQGCHRLHCVASCSCPRSPALPEAPRYITLHSVIQPCQGVSHRPPLHCSHEIATAILLRVIEEM